MHKSYRLKYRANGGRFYFHTRNEGTRDTVAAELRNNGVSVETYEREVADEIDSTIVAEGGAPREPGPAPGEE